MGSALLLTSLFGAIAPVAAAGPLTITNVDSPDPVQSGGQILYTVTVTNTGGARVDNIVLTDQINGVVGFGNPPLLDVVSTRGSCSQTNTQITCTAGTIEGRGVWTVTIRGIVTAAAGTTINNIATVVATKSAQTYTSSAATTTQVEGSGPGGPSPDLTIAKNGPLHVTPGGTITYTLTINNLGTGNALDVKMTDTIPALVTINEIVSTSLFVCPTAPFTSNTIVCTGGRVNAGSNASITVNGTVAPSGAGTLENTSVVDPDNTIDEGELGNTADAAELNNFSNTVVTEVSPNPPPPPAGDKITIDKSGPANAIPGQLVTYTVVVTNGLVGRADYITMTDGTQGLHAASLTVLSAVAESGTDPQCVVAAPTVECTMTRLQPGDTLTVVIQGMVVASAGSTIINTASVNANIKNTGYTARDEVQTIINAGKDFTIAKSDSPDPVCASSFPTPPPPVPAECRGGLTYTLVVGNSGVQSAAGVVVRDPLPPGTTYDDTATDLANPPADVNCNEALPVGSNVVECVITLLGAVSTQTVKIVLAAPPTLGTITNTATVDPSNAFLEADETNNISVVTTTVATGIDLTIRKDDSPPGSPAGFDPIATSGTQTYVITVDNRGTQDATGIRVRDALPAGSIFLSATADNGFTCSHAAGVVECIDGSILGTNSEIYRSLGPDDATITIRIFAMPNVGTMHNEVRVDPLNEIPEYNETNNFEFEDTTVGTGDAGVGAFNQLTVAKTQTSPVPGPVATNGTLSYNLRVSNLGTDPVSNVVVKDFLPTGSRFISASDTAAGPAAFFCSHDGAASGGVVTCTGGDFSGTPNMIPLVPVTRDITITVFAPNAPGTVTNRATVDPDNIVPEGNEFDNDSAIQTIVGVGGANMFNELTITKTQATPGGNEVATSSLVTYDIVVTNTGSDPAFNVKVSDTLPNGFTFLSALDTAGLADPHRFLCTSGAGNTITCTGATLSGTPNAVPGQPITRTISVIARSSAVPGAYVNVAIVDPDNAIAEGNETNNQAAAPTTVKVGPPGFTDLRTTKTASPATLPAHARPGGLITYTITVINDGTDPAFNVKVHDNLPAGTTFVSATDTTAGGPTSNDFTCSVASSVVTCAGATLDGSLGLAGVPTSRQITIKVRAPIENILGVTNQVRVDPDNSIAESNETNNSASAVTDVRSDIDLELDKTGPGSASQGTETDYEITVKNLGTQDATGVLVRDPLPIGLIPLGITVDDTDWACQTFQNPVNLIECVGTLQAGASVKINIHVFVTQDGGTLDNEACVDPDDTILEFSDTAGFNPDGNGNNCKTKVTAVVPLAADLQVNKSASAGTVAPGGDLTYTISVQNNGTGAATSPVTVTDNLSGSVTFVSATATNGWTCTGTTTVACEDPGTGLAPGGSTLITINVKVNTGASAPITNTASVPADAGDPTASPAIEPETSTGNNSDSVTTNISGSGFDLAIAGITDTPDPANRTEQLVYTIIAQNNGSAATTPADAAIVRIAMPTGSVGVDIVGAAGTNGFNCGVSTPTTFPFDCVGDLPAGGETVITLTLDVLIGAPPDLVLSATIDPAAAFTESDEGNNAQIEATTVSGDTCTVSPCIDLVAAEILSSPAGPVGGGASVTYTFGVVNIGDTSTGSTASTDGHIHFRVTGNFASATIAAPTGWTCALITPGPFPAPVPGAWHCDGVLGAGDGAVFTISATAGAVDGTITATGVVDPHSPFIDEFNETNNGPITVSTTVAVP